MFHALKSTAKFALNTAIFALPQKTRQLYKESHELRYWRTVTGPVRSDPEALAKERAHYEHFFTTFFGLDRSDYAGKAVLDIGCGPRGSLEWADGARERVGVDPLADKYRELRDDNHQMTYCCAPSEAIPYPDGHFDIVTSFNSLDHVDDVEATISEMKRVTAPHGRILLIVEIGHAPTPTEPHFLDETLPEKFAPAFRAENLRLFGVRDDHNIYGSMFDRIPFVKGAEGILAVRLERAES